MKLEDPGDVVIDLDPEVDRGREVRVHLEDNPPAMEEEDVELQVVVIVVAEVGVEAGAEVGVVNKT